MSKIDGIDETAMFLQYGYAWRAKVMARWRELPWWKRAYWTMRGKHPKRVL